MQDTSACGVGLGQVSKVRRVSPYNESYVYLTSIPTNFTNNNP